MFSAALANALRAAHNRLMRSADGPEPLLPRWLSCLPKEWLQEQAAEPQPATVTKAEQAKAVAEMARAEKEWSEGRESFSGQRSSDGRSNARLAICCALGLAGLSVRLWKEGPLLLDGLLVCRGPSTAASLALPHSPSPPQAALLALIAASSAHAALSRADRLKRRARQAAAAVASVLAAATGSPRPRRPLRSASPVAPGPFSAGPGPAPLHRLPRVHSGVGLGSRGPCRRRPSPQI